MGGGKFTSAHNYKHSSWRGPYAEKKRQKLLLIAWRDVMPTIETLHVISGVQVFPLCPSSFILKNTMLRELDLFPSSDEGVGDLYSVGPI
jgi:hypothetical protein